MIEKVRTENYRAMRCVNSNRIDEMRAQDVL